MPNDDTPKDTHVYSITDISPPDLTTRCSLLANLWGFGQGVKEGKDMCPAFDHSGGGQAAVEVLMRAVSKDYGLLIEEAMKNIPQCSAPVTAALIMVLESEGHSMFAVRQELQFLVESVGTAFGW